MDSAEWLQTLVVRCGQVQFGLGASVVREIAHVPESGQDADIAGVGGAQYLGKFFGLPRSGAAAAWSLVRLIVPERVALSVDHVAGSVKLERSEISPLPVRFRAAEREWFHGCALYANILLLLISINHLLERVGTVATHVLSEPPGPICEASAPPHEGRGEQAGDLFFAEMDQLPNTIEQQRMTNDEPLPWAELQTI